MVPLLLLGPRWAKSALVPPVPGGRLAKYRHPLLVQGKLSV